MLTHMDKRWSFSLARALKLLWHLTAEMILATGNPSPCPLWLGQYELRGGEVLALLRRRPALGLVILETLPT